MSILSLGKVPVNLFTKPCMRWMKENGFSEVRQWAPFMLIGDNVSFDFRKKRYALENDT